MYTLQCNKFRFNRRLIAIYSPHCQYFVLFFCILHRTWQHFTSQEMNIYFVFCIFHFIHERLISLYIYTMYIVYSSYSDDWVALIFISVVRISIIFICISCRCVRACARVSVLNRSSKKKWKEKIR